jgi:hypothetical protein
VRLHAIGVRLDQLRAATVTGLLDGGAQDRQQRCHVVAVDAFAGYAVPDALVRQRRRDRLTGQRHADRVPVVLHQEDDRGVEDGREVERLVEVALARATVTAHRHHDRRLATKPGRVRDTDRVRQLGRQGRRVRGDVVLVRVVAAVPVALQQTQRLDRIDTFADGGDRVAVGGEQPVVVAEHLGRRHLARLLTVRGGIHGQPALPDERVRLVVQPPSGDQRAEGLDQFRAVRSSEPGAVHGAAVHVDERDGCRGRQKMTRITCHPAIVLLLPIA